METTTLKWEVYFNLRQWKQCTPALDEQFGVNPQIRTQGVYSGPNVFSTAFRG